ncbi:CDP-diacylglycerol--glycerol-3-phosphate 3-phosphatidyltransferase [Poriferisphaera corsica]|uniref:CDP-diacylglycerol--glycerol-3-phosphate 3-phosphatidyltransferase n=1 Tax=Poriferisphaera corsica TaxID=2528020 RepID=A0A517YV11_9BACT|nr:CDP-alcohol phosphatidyltransferase family protein [Poriferisphaera corsica]QDU34093.1 CDP-diacylglycerol--glycerol-3-phosphate 3-phosphatidyltransferase [Poriferisphaera corsica]
MYRQLPNALTVSRLFFAAFFFLTLNQYRYGTNTDIYLIAATVLFVIGAITDALDGYYARKWDVVSKFGRIVDPFCDKILVVGAFIYLMGARFVIPESAADGDFFNMVTGIYPWMVVVILARELLVTGIRGELEGDGINFQANWWGKIKMILQCIVIPIILIIVYLDPKQPGREYLAIIRDILVYATVIATIISGIPYITSAASLIKANKPQ